jgi:hypothetical protein
MQAMDQNVERRIRDRAYSIWKEEGCPEGRDVEHWLRAAQEVAAEEGKNAASPEAQGVKGADAAAATKKPRAPRATAAGSPAAESNAKSMKTVSAKNDVAARARKPKASN